MTPWWLELETAEFVWAFGGLALLGAALAGLLGWGRRRDAEEVRRLVVAQLALAVGRGLPLEGALSALGRELEERSRPALVPLSLRFMGHLLGFPWWTRARLRRRAQTVFGVTAGLQEGGLGQALERAPAAFPAPLPDLLGRAEAQGALAAVLEELAGLDAEAARFRAEVRGSLFYPGWVLLVCLAPAAFYFALLAPRFHHVMDAVGGGDARAAGVLAAVQPVLFLAAPAVILALWLAGSLLVPGGGRVRRALRRTLPWIRGAWGLAVRARTARLLAAALRAGVPLPEALAQLAALAGGEGFERAAARAREGEGLVAALVGAGVLAPREARGLPRGQGAEVGALGLVAVDAEARFRGRLEGLARAAAPLAIAAVGALVASMYWTPFLYLERVREAHLLW